MDNIDRRSFIRKSGVAAAGLVAATGPWIRTGQAAKSTPSDTVNIAVMGIRSRGAQHAESLASLPNVNVSLLCDIDERLLPKAVADLEKVSGKKARTETDIRKVLVGQPAPAGETSPLTRFLAEWELSQANARGHFSDHWVIAIREHQDRYHNALTSVALVSRHSRKLKPFHWQPEARGTALGDQIHAFDRVAGFANAWYFHMVSGGLVPHAIAYALQADLAEGYGYLSDGGTGLLKRWLAQPYTV